LKKLLFLLAVAGLIPFAACKSGETKVEGNADSTAQMEVSADTASMVSDSLVPQ